ncbi:MAG TPA: hypothetical protein VG964_03045 [Candidatus Saccharimonadales bacterium]|nr:hypothetical protein [Candidatus Saccharimonadales bacterium]
MKKLSRNKKIYYPLAVILAAAIVFGVLELTGVTHVFRHQKSANQPALLKDNTSKAPAAGNSSSKSTSTTLPQGGATDTHGQAAPSTPASNWTTSSSGLLTLQSPAANSTLKSGDLLAGTAKVDQIEYRLVDDQVGVLAQGSLSVVSGKFSGKINFSPKASTGQLDVFSYNASGAETNEVQVPVKF